MLKFIGFELRRNFKRPQFRILIGLLLICEIFMLTILNNRSQTEDVYSLSRGSMEVSALTRFNLSDDKKEFVEKQVQSVNIKGKFFEYYKSSEQWNKMYLTGMEVYCYNVDMRTSVPLKSQSNFDYANYQHELKQIQKKYKLTQVPKKPKDSTWFQPVGTTGYEMIPFYQQGARYFERLYRNGLNPLSYSSVNSATVFVQLSRNVFFLGVPILIVLLFFNIRKNYRDSGLDKSLMVIPGLKEKFYMYKLISDLILILFIVFIPLIIFMLILGMKNGFDNFNYPVLANKNGIFGLNFSKIDGFVYNTKYCISTNSMYNVGLTYLSTEMARNPYLDFTTLGTLNLLSILMTILSIGVYYQFTFIMNYLFQNAYFSFILTLLIVALLYFLSPLGSTNLFNIINPLTYRDPTMIITGTSCYPYSVGMIVLSIYNLMLYFFGKYIFQRNFYKGLNITYRQVHQIW